MSALIEPEELLEKLNSDKNIKTIDGTFVMPGSGEDPVETYQRKRIGKAIFFDIDVIADKKTGLPHMLPSPLEFAEAIGKLGISRNDEIVIYGQHNLMMGPCRIWWMFRTFGHENVKVLNGSLELWEKSRYPLNTHIPDTPVPCSYVPAFRSEKVATMDDVVMASDNDTCFIVDARSAERYLGKVPEPRPGLREGHIPGSINIPCTELVDLRTGKLKNLDKVEQIIKNAGLDDSKPIISSCGSGVTACVLVLALYEMGRKDVKVYDGSWSEWGQMDMKTAVAKPSG